MPYIKRNTIQAVQDLDLVKTIGKYVKLKKKGSTFTGLSPFTNEKTPSFNVSPAKGIWKCFSTGKGGNNAVSFLMDYKNMQFPEAVETLANANGISIDYDNSESAKKYQEEQKKKDELSPVLYSTLRKYQEEFAKLPADHPAKKEVYDHRGYTDDIVEKYGIGYAPGKRFIYDLCVEHGRKKDAMELGLITDKGDKWSDRVIYPLWDMQRGKRVQIGLAGRRLGDNEKYAKWMNSNNNKLFNKDYYWYGLDTARNEIAKRGEAWLVEGYNDVIAWQENGIENTIASCGTAVTSNQINKLKKFCDRIILCFDPDKAGKKAMMRLMPAFFKAGFRVYVKSLEGMDPDDYIRSKNPTAEDMQELGTNTKIRDDGFQFYINNLLTGDPVDDAMEAKKLTSLISCMNDEAMKQIYLGMLSKESAVKITDLKRWLKEAEAETEQADYKSKFQTEQEYQLPKEVKEPIEKLLPLIKTYDLFMANNKIYCQTNKEEPPYTFKVVSNFDIEIIQHMRDEQFPSKLVRIKNVHGHAAVFDMPSSDMNTPMAFETAVTNHGNFRWKGKREQHELLKTFLFDRMGTGRRIDVLGWQPEGFWAWNNLVVLSDGSKIDVDPNGCFVHDETSYYIPSANDIYAHNRYKYDAQKRFLSIKPTVSFLRFTEMLTKVHRAHGMMGILFSIASIFQDIVVRDLNAFPLLFLYGPASSGKDQLADACQTFFGQPQVAINLEGKASTDKAKIREFAQLSNAISQLSEYKPGNADLDGILKGLWDRRGYKRGNLESKVSTESIPILSSVIMTGNFEPDQDALITRCIYSNMNKTAFTDEERKNYELLNDVVKKGYSGYTDDFMKYRSRIENNFTYQYRKFYETFNARLPEDTNSRMITNLSVLGTFYMMFKDDFQFAFSLEDIMEHFEKLIELQMTKLNSASIITKFWDCYLASMRGTLQDQIRVNRDFVMEGTHLYFQWTACYNKISRQWYSQYSEKAPGKTVMSEALRKEKSWIEFKKGHRYGVGRDAPVTSAFVIDLDRLPVKDDIVYAIEFQQAENFGNNFGAPVTSQDNYDADEKNNKKERDDLPF